MGTKKESFRQVSRAVIIAQRTTQQHLTNGGNWANKWRQIDTKGEEERAVKKREKGEIQIVLPAK